MEDSYAWGTRGALENCDEGSQGGKVLRGWLAVTPAGSCSSRSGQSVSLGISWGENGRVMKVVRALLPRCWAEALQWNGNALRESPEKP